MQKARYQELGICGQGLIPLGPQDVICRARQGWGSPLESRKLWACLCPHAPHLPTSEARTTDDLSK